MFSFLFFIPIFSIFFPFYFYFLFFPYEKWTDTPQAACKLFAPQNLLILMMLKVYDHSGWGGRL